MSIEHPHIPEPFQNDEYWRQELTPEEREKQKQYADEIKAISENAMKRTALHPQTGEVGIFVRYEGVFPRVHAVYRTNSGVEFYKM